jgi:cysteine desulfurase/selenocysteine lyase|tara:strand:+ start:321 stop:1553 length:1233 start_codon:yes stop_codon:yes gene_type:complete
MLKAYKKAKSIKQIRACFPALAYSDLTYLDNAASTQTVDTSVKAISDYYYNYRANVHRGDFKTSSIASDKYDQARQSVANLLGCEPFEVAFTSGTTESLNMVAEHYKEDGRKVIITALEHHSNALPWMRQGRTTENGGLIVCKATDTGDVSMQDWEEVCSENPGSIVSFLTQSNLSGHMLKWHQMVAIAKEHDCEVILDACQSIAHQQIDTKLNNIDWIAFSGHKMFAGTGIGVLFHRGGFTDMVSRLGGGTVSHVDFDTGYVLNNDVSQVEAGTPNISGVHSMGAAADWIMEVGYKEIQENEAEFFYMLQDKGLFEIEELKLIGDPYPRSVYSFVVDPELDYNASDIAGFLDITDVCVRTGHMCAYPASNRYNNKGTGVFRVSSAPYNDEHDCVKLVEGIWQAIKKLNK